MNLQNPDAARQTITEKFLALKTQSPSSFERRLTLSWSNWGFGLESLEDSVARLARNDVGYIELHGNHYGPDLGYRVADATKTLDHHGLKVSGVCGMFSEDNDLSSPRGTQRQAALDYIRREVEFAAEMGGDYLLVVPAAVGRPVAYDDAERERSVTALGLVADEFVTHGIKAAIEPIRSAETSLVHSVREAQEYIELLDHPGVQHINGDVFHMQTEERNIAEAVIAAGSQLTNLHMADSNRMGLGRGSIDLDTIIMALYLIGFNKPGHYVTPEPLGPGGAPYPAMNRRPDPAILDDLVAGSVHYFREREDAILSL